MLPGRAGWFFFIAFLSAAMGSFAGTLAFLELGPGAEVACFELAFSVTLGRLLFSKPW